MPQAGFETAIPASEQSQTDALKSTASGKQGYRLRRIPHGRTIHRVRRNPRKTVHCHKRMQNSKHSGVQTASWHQRSKVQEEFSGRLV